MINVKPEQIGAGQLATVRVMLQRVVPRHQLPISVTLAGALAALLTGCGSVEESRGLLGSGAQLVRVNEISSANNYSFQDPDAPSEYDDWVELYNASEHTAYLEGYFITDNKDRPGKHVLPPEAVVPGKGFLVLIADNQPAQGPLHLSFALDRQGGESVYLADPRGNLLDGTDFGPTVLFACTRDGGQCDFSYARYPDGSGTFQWCGESTPGKSNGSACPDPAVPLP